MAEPTNKGTWKEPVFELKSETSYSIDCGGAIFYNFISKGRLKELPEDATWDQVISTSGMNKEVARDVLAAAKKTYIFKNNRKGS